MAASNTVILGAGIIGLSTAYYLAKHQQPSTIHLVEPSPELFASASGHAAGFLARDWFGPDMSTLGALSFDEHRHLAEAYDGATRWGYQRSTAVSYTPGPAATGPQTLDVRGEDWLRTGGSRAEAAHGSHGGGEEATTTAAAAAAADEMAPPWLRRAPGDALSVIGDAGSTAQLDPLRLCRFLLDECLAQGVRLHHPATALAVLADTRNELSSVRIAAVDTADTAALSPPSTTTSTETDVPCTKLVIAAGAWSAHVFAELFPTTTPTTSSEQQQQRRRRLPIASLAGHSLVVKSPRWTDKMAGGCHAVFATSEAGFSPEVFSRAGGEIWIGGLNSSAIPLPQRATDREVSSEAIAQLRKEAAALLLGSGKDAAEFEKDLELVREALCFRPVTPHGTPIISKVDDEYLGGSITTRPGVDGGVYLAAGHGPWGISLSLGTGKVLAEMVQGRKLSADVRSLGM